MRLREGAGADAGTEIGFIYGIQEVSGSIPLISTIEALKFLGISRLFVYRKPRVRRVVQKSFSDEEEIKTPFAIMEVRSANCTRIAKGGHSSMGMNDIHSLSHTRWNCKYHIVFAPKYRRQVFYKGKKQ